MSTIGTDLNLKDDRTTVLEIIKNYKSFPIIKASIVIAYTKIPPQID